MKKSDGFSLIELMTVLGIVAIITVMSFSGLLFFSKKSTIEVLGSQLIRAIRLTRSEAILRKDTVYLCGSVDQTTCSDGWQAGYIIRTENRVIYHFQPITDKGILHWRAYPFNTQALEFLATGLPNTENGTFWFCALDAVTPTWAIMLNQSGRTRIEYPDKNGIVRDDQGIELIC